MWNIRKNIQADALLNKKAKSCGCSRFIEKRKSTKYSPEISSYRAKVSNYKAHAKMAGREFSLTFDEAIKLFKSNCHYCNTPPSNTYNLISRNRKYTKGTVYCLSKIDDYTIKYNGIDRKDSNLGYTVANCVSCCFRCNSAKSDSSYNEFIAWPNNLVMYRNT